MKKSLVLISSLVLATAFSSACATKGFVRNEIAQVSGKVDTLSASLEETQERTRQNETRIGQVDTKAGAAQSAADQAGSSATAANSAAASANTAAAAANAKASAVEASAKRIVLEVVLSENQGNFTFGGSTLPDAAKARIDELVSQLMSDPKGAYFEIEGHTDNVGDKLYNEKLGMERADAVKRYLYEQHKIPLHRMNVISYGEDKPAAENNSRDNRAQNRRVVIRILA